MSSPSALIAPSNGVGGRNHDTEGEIMLNPGVFVLSEFFRGFFLVFSKSFSCLSAFFRGFSQHLKGKEEVPKVVETGRRLHAFHMNTWAEKCHACGTSTGGSLNVQLNARGGIIVICPACEKELLTYMMRNWLRGAKGRDNNGGFCGPIKKEAIVQADGG